MLKILDIRNFTLIGHLTMQFYPGFSVIPERQEQERASSSVPSASCSAIGLTSDR